MDAPYRHPPLPAAVPELRIEAMSPSRLFFSFTGRIDRATYWRVGVVGLLVVGLTMVALLRVAGLSAERAEGAVNLLLSWPAIAISVKRWHDRDRSGWWVLINLLPLIGWAWALIDNGFMPGDEGENRYGPSPQLERLI